MALELTTQPTSTSYDLPAELSTRAAQLSDARAITELINAVSIIDIGASSTEENDLVKDWNQPTFDLARDSRVVLNADGAIVGYAEHWNITEPRVQPYLYVKALLDYRPVAVPYLLYWGEARALEQLDEVPPETQYTLRSSCFSTDEATPPLLNAAGFEHVRSFFQMRIELDAAPPAPAFPAGITVRVLRDKGDDLHAMYVANEEAFEDHWGYVPVPFETVKYWIDNDPDFDPTLQFLAVTQTPDGEEIAGTCLCRFKTTEDAGMGWINDLGVRRPWRRQGIAQALLQHAFGELWRRGQCKIGLGVDAESLTGALRLYQRVGMHVHRQSDAYHKILRPGIDLSKQTLDD